MITNEDVLKTLDNIKNFTESGKLMQCLMNTELKIEEIALVAAFILKEIDESIERIKNK